MDSPKLCTQEVSGWRRLNCSRCLMVFYICPPCWRGQRYCSIACQSHCKRSQHRKAQKKYSQTVGFKEDRKLYQRQYRKLPIANQGSLSLDGPIEKLLPVNQKSFVTDPSSTIFKKPVIEEKLQRTCLFCGRIWSGDG